MGKNLGLYQNFEILANSLLMNNIRAYYLSIHDLSSDLPPGD